MSNRFFSDYHVGFCEFALIVSFNSIVKPDGKIGGLNKSPCQIFIAVLCVGIAFLFTITEPGAIDAAAIGGIATNLFKAGYTPCFQHDGKTEGQTTTVDTGQVNELVS